MALFGNRRDINLFKSISRELIHKIIEQEVGYYILDLNKTQSNNYSESIGAKKFYSSPTLIKCLIEREDMKGKYSEYGPNISRVFSFIFLRDDLKIINVVPKIGDIVLWNNDYYELNLINENQIIAGKDPEYNYGETYLDNYGDNYSVICKGHYIAGEKLGINNLR